MENKAHYQNVKNLTIEEIRNLVAKGYLLNLQNARVLLAEIDRLTAALHQLQKEQQS